MPCESRACCFVASRADLGFDWARAIMIRKWQVNIVKRTGAGAHWRCVLVHGKLPTESYPDCFVVIGLAECRAYADAQRSDIARKTALLGVAGPINLAMSRSLERLGLGALPRVIGHGSTSTIRTVGRAMSTWMDIGVC